MACRTILLTVFLVSILTACSPAASGITSTVDVIPIAGTVSFSTVTAVTVQPFQSTPLSPDTTPPAAPISPTLTPIPALQSGLGPTELKYRLLDQFPDLFFCDPDFYPVARADETDLALQRFPDVQANAEEFNAILVHNQLPDQPTYTDEQKLLIYREHKKLAAVHFELVDNRYQFQLQIAKNKGQGELINGTIDGQGSINVQKENRLSPPAQSAWPRTHASIPRREASRSKIYRKECWSGRRMEAGREWQAPWFSWGEQSSRPHIRSSTWCWRMGASCGFRPGIQPQMGAAWGSCRLGMRSMEGSSAPPGWSGIRATRPMTCSPQARPVSTGRTASCLPAR